MPTPAHDYPRTLPTLTGQRISLRALRSSDVPLLHRYLQDSQVHTRLERLPHPYTLDHSRQWVQATLRMAGEGTGYHFAVADRESDDFLGMMGINGVNWDDRRGEIGYWMARPYWRQGLTEEALRLLVAFAFRELRFRRVFAEVIESNRPSAALLEKVGFTREVVRREIRRRGRQWLDMYTYGLLKEEFTVRRRSPL